MKTDHATAEVFFTAFRALKKNEKEAFLKKVLKDKTIREDLIDIALIERAKKDKGTTVEAKRYFEHRRKSGSSS